VENTMQTDLKGVPTKRIFFLNRFFPPDQSVTSRLVGDLATDLFARGHEVHVITSQQLYDQPHAHLPAHEFLSGVEVHRVDTTRFGRSALPGRAIDYLSFYGSARRVLLATAQRGDIVVAMTDPPLISIVAMHVAARKGAYLVNWLQNIYPEVAVALGAPLLKGPVLRALCALRDRSLKAASANVVLSLAMADKILARGAPPDHIYMISNWSDDDAISPVAPRDNPLRQQWQLENKFVVGYSGNLGRAHDYDTILAAAERLHAMTNIVFVCIGSGHLMKELAEQVRQRGLRNFLFLPYQDETMLKFSLGVADVHWLSLKPAVEGLTVPSKFYAIAAAGRPIIAICSKDGEIARRIRQHRCGEVVAPGDIEALVKAILRFAAESELVAAMGRKARDMLAAGFSRRQALQKWHSALQSIG
jgi:colanic acid biosynthesis glycosyl transferase WcaI